MIEEALDIAELRRRHPSNADFGAALRRKGISLDHRNRAALIKIAELVEQHGAQQVGAWIERCHYTNPGHVWPLLSRHLRPRPKPTRSLGEPPTHEPDAEPEFKGKTDEAEAEE